MKVGNNFTGSMLKFPSSVYCKILLYPILGKSETTLVYSNSCTLTVSSICVSLIARAFEEPVGYKGIS